MTTIHDVPAGYLIPALAEALRSQGSITSPEWTPYVKTGVDRERIPDDPDWYYTRAASILRKVALHGPIGVNHLALFYGGPHKRTAKPTHTRRASRRVIRSILQQLEAAGLVYSQTKLGTEKVIGRSITPTGHSLLDNTAHSVRGSVEEKFPSLANY